MNFTQGEFIYINKPYRMTSFGALAFVRTRVSRKVGVKRVKIGHAGTLDPLATGVLLVCIGNACKRAQELQDHPKEYIARIRFGATTPSYDLEKEVDRRFPYEHITEASVRAALLQFLGEQEQVAPLFSAKSVDGVRAYELARKLYRSGRFSELDSAALETLQRNKIDISELELLEFVPGGTDSPESVATLGHVRGRGPEQAQSAGAWEGSRSDDSGESVPPGISATSPSARINVADTSALGLPEAVIRIGCSKGTYIRAFARDLGEALGSGAHLGGLIRTCSGSFRIEDALSLDQALALLQ